MQNEDVLGKARIFFGFLMGLMITATAGADFARGQDTQTLFDGVESHGGFGGVVMKVSELDGDAGFWIGGRGAWLINLKEGHALSLGGGGFGLVSEHEVPDPGYGNPDTTYYAQTGYGGFEIEYFNRTTDLVHFTFSAMIGAGGIGIRSENLEETGEEYDPYFLFEPGGNVELNVTEFFRVAAGLSYRFTSGIDKAGFGDGDFSGLAANVTLKFGQLRW